VLIDFMKEKGISRFVISDVGNRKIYLTSQSLEIPYQVESSAEEIVALIESGEIPHSGIH
jgi:hypothetical protein